MQEAISIKRHELVPGRDFTHPDHISADFDIMLYMISQLRLLLDYPHRQENADGTVYFKQPGSPNWFHRLVLAKPERLRVHWPLRIVGFFGERRPDADVELAHDFDKTLLGEIDDHPGLFSYSTMAVDRGNYANLVVFGEQEARSNWSRSRAHAQAVDVLAPGYYWSVCIYNGDLPGGIQAPDRFHLQRVKYFDYQEVPTWRGIRELDPPMVRADELLTLTAAGE